MKELRCLVFTDQEVVAAVFDRRRKRREAIPKGTVTGVSYDNAEGVKAIIHMADDYGADQSFTVNEAEAAAALVNYCMGRKVPLPVESDKSLYLIKGALTLMITMNFNKPPRMVGGDAPRAGNASVA